MQAKETFSKESKQSKCFHLYRKYLNLSVKQLSIPSLPELYK